MKLIFNGEPDDAAEVVGIMLRERDQFERIARANGWGWNYRIANGRGYFLRRITGGVSANLTEQEPQ